MCTAASSGASAFQALPAGSRCPTRPGIRGLSSQTRTSATQRSAAGRCTQVSKWSVGSHTGLPWESATVVTSPAAAAVSTSRATVGSSRCSATAVDLRSRTPSPPLRSAEGGVAPQRSSSSSIRRTVSNAAPAPVRSTSALSLVAVATVGTSSTASGVVRPPRIATPTSPGTCAVAPPRGTSRRRDSSSSAGEAASAGSTVTRAEPVSASPPASMTCASIARAGSLSPAMSVATDAGSGGGSESGRSPLTPTATPPVRPSATPVSARSPPTESQASPSSSRRSTAEATTVESALTNSCSPVRLDRPVSTRASSTASSARVSWSSARSIEDLVAAREASWAES